MSILTVILLPLILGCLALAARFAWHFSQRDEPTINDYIGARGLANGAFEWDEENVAPMIHLADAFEPETAMLWDTEMPLLKAIDEAAERGCAEETLRPLHGRSVLENPELLEGVSLNARLQFLADADLISRGHGIVYMTASGAEFLKCRVSSGSPQELCGSRHK